MEFIAKYTKTQFNIVTPKRLFFYKTLLTDDAHLCYTLFANDKFKNEEAIMTLCDELYFEITLCGTRPELKKFISILRSGELDEFFEFSSDYIDYGDEFNTVSDSEETYVVFTNDDYGIEIDRLEVDEFLEVICRAAENLDVRGRVYDVDEEEYSFISSKGDSYYVNAKKIRHNDELDERAREEDLEED